MARMVIERKPVAFQLELDEDEVDQLLMVLDGERELIELPAAMRVVYALRNPRERIGNGR